MDFRSRRKLANLDAPRRFVTGNRTGHRRLQPLRFAWSPDGTSIAFTASVPVHTAPAWAPPAIVPLLEPRPASPVQVFTVPAAGGEPRRISAEALDFVGEPAWMPNGQSVLCAEKGGEIFSLRIADGAVRELTRNDESAQLYRDPVPSPDGARIAYTAAARKPQYYAVQTLWVMNADGSRARQLAGSLGRDVRHPQWSSDSRTVYFIADDRGATHVYAARNDGSVHPLTARAERLRGFSLADNGRAVTVRSSSTEGSAVFTFTTDVPGGGWTLLDLNQQLMAERDWGAVEELPFESAGKPMQAWLVKPPAFDPARKYPLLLDIRDAPQRMSGAGFSIRDQILAAAGYVVLLANPRGVPGYGEEFGNLLATQIPGDPADDLLRAVDRTLAKSYIDPRRVTVAGGPLAVWLLSHSNRFSSGVVRRLAQSRMGPLAFSGDFKVPILTIAGAHDPGADLLLALLQSKRVDSALVRLPATPAGAILELQSTLAWMGK